MPKYEVGQILFILAGANKGVVPAIVCEEIKRKSLSGTTVDYLVNFPGQEEPVNLKKAVKHIFVSEAAVKDYMMNNAELAINNLIKRAAAVAKKTFDYNSDPGTLVPENSKKVKKLAPDSAVEPVEISASSSAHTAQLEIEADGAELVLEDGITARIHLPPEFQDLIGTGRPT